MSKKYRIVRNAFRRYRVQCLGMDGWSWFDCGTWFTLESGSYFVAFETRYLWLAKLYRWLHGDSIPTHRCRNVMADKWEEVA